MPRGPKRFRTTVVRPYLEHEKDSMLELREINDIESEDDNFSTPSSSENEMTESTQVQLVKRGRGRPRKNPNLSGSYQVDSYLNLSIGPDEFMANLTAREKIRYGACLKIS